MSICSVAVTDAIKFDAMRKFLFYNGDILIDFGLFACGSCFGSGDVRIIDVFDGS